MTQTITVGRATFRKSDGGITVQTGPASIRAAVEAEDVLRLYGWLTEILGNPISARERRTRVAAREVVDLIASASLTDGAPEEFEDAVANLEESIEGGTA